VAARLFAENGGNPTSLESIAAAAGVTRTALYYYFPTKADLVRSVLMRTMHWDWWTTVIEAGSGADQFSERLHLLLSECVNRSLDSNGDVYFALLDAARGDSEIRAGLRSYVSAMRSGVRDLVRDCRDRGHLPADTDVDAVSEGVVGLVWCVASGLAHSRNKTAVAQVRNAIDLVCGEPTLLMATSRKRHRASVRGRKGTRPTPDAATEENL
jgi:AcrR family transcriptional regulator